MAQSETLEWVKVIAPLMISWPVVGLLAVIIFHKPILKVIEQFTNAGVRRAKLGPVEIERELTEIARQGQEAVSSLNRLIELGAESRLLELEITDATFGGFFTEQQQQRMKEHIKEYRSLTSKASSGQVLEKI